MTPDEKQISEPLSYCAHAVMTLITDPFAGSQYTGMEQSVNAIDVVMQSQSLSAEAAKLVLQAKIQAHEEQYCHLKDQLGARSHHPS